MNRENTLSDRYIDLVEVVRQIWKNRVLLGKCCLSGALIGVIIAFSIPKEFVVNAKITPETANAKNGQLGGLAAMAGINLNSGNTGSEDAFYPEIYPDIVGSTPFLLEFVDLPVKCLHDSIATDLYDYLLHDQRTTWWNSLAAVPFKLIGWVKSVRHSPTSTSKEKEESLRLTSGQDKFIRILRDRISVTIDNKTSVLIVSVVMQDPAVTARVAGAVLDKLQQYVTDYRTRKAKRDLEFSERLFMEARNNYYQNQQIYARYVDGNRNVTAAAFRTEEERLRNEMNLAYGVYTQMAQQVEMYKVKVQEQTPVFSVIEPAKVPLKAIKPRKLMLIFGMTVLAGCACIGWSVTGMAIKKLNGDSSTQNNRKR